MYTFLSDQQRLLWVTVINVAVIFIAFVAVVVLFATGCSSSSPTAPRCDSGIFVNGECTPVEEVEEEEITTPPKSEKAKV